MEVHVSRTRFILVCTGPLGAARKFIESPFHEHRDSLLYLGHDSLDDLLDNLWCSFLDDLLDDLWYSFLDCLLDEAGELDLVLDAPRTRYLCSKA